MVHFRCLCFVDIIFLLRKTPARFCLHPHFSGCQTGSQSALCLFSFGGTVVESFISTRLINVIARYRLLGGDIALGRRSFKSLSKKRTRNSIMASSYGAGTLHRRIIRNGSDRWPHFEQLGCSSCDMSKCMIFTARFIAIGFYYCERIATFEIQISISWSFNNSQIPPTNQYFPA